MLDLFLRMPCLYSRTTFVIILFPCDRVKPVWLRAGDLGENFETCLGLKWEHQSLSPDPLLSFLSVGVINTGSRSKSNSGCKGFILYYGLHYFIKKLRAGTEAKAMKNILLPGFLHMACSPSFLIPPKTICPQVVPCRVDWGPHTNHLSRKCPSDFPTK